MVKNDIQILVALLERYMLALGEKFDDHHLHIFRVEDAASVECVAGVEMAENAAYAVNAAYAAFGEVVAVEAYYQGVP